MPMPKPKKASDINIGANGGTNQEGRRAKTLDIKVVRPSERDIPDLHMRLAEYAAKASGS